RPPPFHPSKSGKQHWLDHVGPSYEWRNYFKRLSVAQVICSLLLNLKAEILKLLGIDRRGRVAHQIDGAGCFRKGDHFADIRFPRHQCHDAIESQRDSAVRRRAVLERVQEEAEALARLLVRQAQD